MEGSTPPAQAMLQEVEKCDWQAPGERSLLQLLVNCWDSSGLLEPEQRRPSSQRAAA